MATVDEIKAKLDEIPPALDAIAADEDALKAQIQALQDQLNNGTQVTAQQMQELYDKADAISTRVRAIDASVG